LAIREFRRPTIALRDHSLVAGTLLRSSIPSPSRLVHLSMRISERRVFLKRGETALVPVLARASRAQRLRAPLRGKGGSEGPERGGGARSVRPAPDQVPRRAVDHVLAEVQNACPF
jgi:hypothetical protein